MSREAPRVASTVRVRPAETGPQWRTFGTFERNLLAERSACSAPGCGNIRLQTTSSNQGGAHHTHTAPALTHSLPRRCGWVHCSYEQREREEQVCLSVCVRLCVCACACMYVCIMHHTTERLIKTYVVSQSSMT